MSFFDEIYRARGQARAPWEIDAPQPEIVALEHQGAFVSPVLDVGCGSGENALYLASRGFEVVGVDIAPAAIALAERKAEERGLEVPFLALDALELPRLGRRFPTAVDSGLFHVFSDEGRPRFADALASVVEEGGTYLMICFSEHQPGVWGPRRVTQAEIRGTFSQGWRVASIRPATFLVRLDPPDVRAWLARIVRVGEGT
ncbi:MAG: class I SAM-dependent methyltransferase [Actinomycetota bacterium]